MGGNKPAQFPALIEALTLPVDLVVNSYLRSPGMMAVHLPRTSWGMLWPTIRRSRTRGRTSSPASSTCLSC